MHKLRSHVLPWKVDAQIKVPRADNLQLWKVDAQIKVPRAKIWRGDAEIQIAHAEIWRGDAEMQIARAEIWRVDAEIKLPCVKNPQLWRVDSLQTEEGERAQLLTYPPTYLPP